MNCSVQEYDMSFMIKDHGNHCENQDGGCQNITTCSVECFSVGSNIDGAEPSVTIWGAGGVLF